MFHDERRTDAIYCTVRDLYVLVALLLAVIIVALAPSLALPMLVGGSVTQFVRLLVSYTHYRSLKD